MGAKWQKNEVVAAKRRCGMLVVKSDGTFLPRDAEFSAALLAITCVCGANSPDFDQAVGSWTN